MLYDGHPAAEPGAVVCRVAPTFLRFGSYEIHSSRDDHATLGKLVDFTLERFYPQHVGNIPAFYEEVMQRTAWLASEWMRVGFVHGVMNTDNLSILGLTIDYGPYGWLEAYDPLWTPNTTDAHGRRYCYGNQPHIAQWNLARLAEALLPLARREALEEGLTLYADTFNAAWPRALAQKLGLASLGRPGDDDLTRELFEALSEVETDWTIFFRRLAAVPLEGGQRLAPLAPAFYDEQAPRPKLATWLERYAARVRDEGIAGAKRDERMRRANPKYVFRNYLAQQAIDALEGGDAAPLERLMRALEHPYDEQPEHEALAARRPEWARHKAGCSALSCSS
jgi:uncharacterized protein YdiU (UPF0061 family)